MQRLQVLFLDGAIVRLIFKLEYWEQEHLLELYLQEERESEE